MSSLPRTGPDPVDDIAITREAFEAFNSRDRERLENLMSDELVLHNAVTGSVVGRERYEGREALSSYLLDVSEVWSHLELRPRTFERRDLGRVLVAGSVLAGDGDNVREVDAAWIWTLRDGKIVHIRVLPTAGSRGVRKLRSDG